MKSDPDPQKGGLQRRDFIREGFRNFLQSMAKVVEKRLDRFQLPPELRQPSPGPSRPGSDADPALEGRILRPPGALREELFVERCQRTGECVPACPVQAIRFLSSDESRLNGTPHIEPQLQACVVCEGLHCMRACPSGALSIIPRHLIEMGIAELRLEHCVRERDEDCRICVEKCPIGPTAISIPQTGGRVEVKADGCVGCGVCEMYCPTRPKAIVVRLR